VLYGSAPFEGMLISTDHMRLQLEQQVMGKLLQLRQGTLLAGTDAKRQIDLIAASLSTMMVLFRSVVRLHGGRPAEENAALAEQVGTLAGLDPQPFVRAVRHVRGERKLETGEANGVLHGYLAGIERLNSHLDGYRPA
jgi:hypothetical protein